MRNNKIYDRPSEYYSYKFYDKCELKKYELRLHKWPNNTAYILGVSDKRVKSNFCDSNYYRKRFQDRLYNLTFVICYYIVSMLIVIDRIQRWNFYDSLLTNPDTQ